MDDRHAITRMQQGDIAGLEALVHRYQDRALRAAYLICLDRDLAQEVTQDAFIRAYRNIKQFDGERPFGPWFLRIATNEALMALRQRKHTIHLSGQMAETALSDQDPSIEQTLMAAETREAIWDALAQLSPKQRAAVVSRYYLGLGEAEMSHIFGCPRGTIKRRLHDARQRLRCLLPAWVRGTDF